MNKNRFIVFTNLTLTLIGEKMIDLASDDDDTPAANAEGSTMILRPILQRKVYIFWSGTYYIVKEW